MIFNDRLHLKIEMQYFPYDASIFQGYAELPRTQQSSTGLLDDIEVYCKDDSTQNVHIRCGTEVFPACRFLLAARSTRFRPLVSTNDIGNFSSVTVKDVAPAIMEQVLQFVHTDSCEWLEEDGTTLEQLIQLFQASERYSVRCLTHKVATGLSSRMNSNNVLDIWEVAETSSCQELKDKCSKYMDTIPGSQVASLMKNSTAFGVMSGLMSANTTPRTP
eukprot:GHVO01037158.1.p1 GENE.GHVO01037158.1~~GHVO01037158.1.p1  ORF type:complete len:218 (-),score=25.88 GHVO01037158.1:75-728(-)